LEKKDKKILITGGHLTPAFITAATLQQNGFMNIVWVGVKHTQMRDTSTSPEFQLVSELNIPFYNLITGKFWRRWNRITILNALKDLLLIPVGFIGALGIILREQPDLIMSFGGYVALPVVIIAKILRKKVITHEQVLNPGIANKIISKFSDKILLSWEQTEKHFKNKSTFLSGNPSLAEFRKKRNNIIDFENDLPIITILGGNQGAHVINTAIFAILENLLKQVNIIHQTGRSEVTKDKYKASEIKSNLSDKLASRYMFKPFMTENYFEILEKSDLIISRGGANTMTDLILKAKKSIIIPIPWSSSDEQLQNAKFLEELGLSSIIEYENEINPELLNSEIKRRLKDTHDYDKNRVRKLQSLIRYSPSKIFKQILELL